MALAIRRATAADAALLSALAARTFTETFGHLYPDEDLQAFLTDAYAVERQQVILTEPAYAVFLLEDDGVAVGDCRIYGEDGPLGLAACTALAQRRMPTPPANTK